MRSVFFFTVIAAFWLAMNVLLWRSLTDKYNKFGNAVPVDVVWDKILTAPDNSSLDIYDHDKKIGYCRWVPTVGNTTQALSKSLEEDYEPDGLIPPPSGYGLNVECNTSLYATNRISFELQVRLSTNETWQDLRLLAKMRPTTLDIHAMEASQKVSVKFNSEDTSWQRTLKFSELENPQALLSNFGGIEALALGGMANLPAQEQSLSHAAAALKWDAHEDWMQFGHNKVRVYRLETSFLGQGLYIYISRVGEILWVEAPNKLTFRNEAFNHF